MAEVTSPRLVQLLIGVIYNMSDLLGPLEARMAERIGPIESKSPAYPFDLTDYYRQEMGEDLGRTFYAFRNLIDPAEIVEIKIAADLLERAFAEAGRRRVNLDPLHQAQ